MDLAELIPRSIEEITRIEKLDIVLKRAGISYTDMGKRIGVSRSSIYKMLTAETISTWRFAQLLTAGIPQELLPEAKNIAPGPKPRRAKNKPKSES